MNEQEKKIQNEELSNAGGAELSDEAVEKATGGFMGVPLKDVIDCPNCGYDLAISSYADYPCTVTCPKCDCVVSLDENGEIAEYHGGKKVKKGGC